MAACVGDSKVWGLLPAAQFLTSKEILVVVGEPCEPGQLTFRNEGAAGAGDWYINIDGDAEVGTKYALRIQPNVPVTLRGAEIVEGSYRAIASITSAGSLHWFRSWREKP